MIVAMLKYNAYLCIAHAEYLAKIILGVNISFRLSIFKILRQILGEESNYGQNSISKICDEVKKIFLHENTF